jgi:hypothetical protein
MIHSHSQEYFDGIQSHLCSISGMPSTAVLMATKGTVNAGAGSAGGPTGGRESKSPGRAGCVDRL